MAHTHHHGHDHHHAATGNISVAFWLNTGFAILEVAGGFYTNSVAIMSDALHDFGDSLSLGLSWYFQKKSTRKRDGHYSYGYSRFSLLGAFINSVVLIVGSIFILQESIRRVISPQQADAKGMIFLAIIGIVANGIAMFRLRSGNTLNERVVSLHFLEDVLGWAAVLVGSVVMLFVDIPILDPVLSILISAYVLFNVFRNLRKAFHIFLQGIPENMDVDGIRSIIKKREGIVDVHDVHIWSMDGQYNIMTLHVVLKPGMTQERMETLKQEVRHDVQHLNIQHLTIETEFEDQVCELKEH